MIYRKKEGFHLFQKARIIVPIYNDGFWLDYRNKILEGNVNEHQEFIAVSVDGKPLSVIDLNKFQPHEYKLIE